MSALYLEPQLPLQLHSLRTAKQIEVQFRLRNLQVSAHNHQGMLMTLTCSWFLHPQLLLTAQMTDVDIAFSKKELQQHQLLYQLRQVPSALQHLPMTLRIRSFRNLEMAQKMQVWAMMKAQTTSSYVTQNFMRNGPQTILHAVERASTWTWQYRQAAASSTAVVCRMHRTPKEPVSPFVRFQLVSTTNGITRPPTASHRMLTRELVWTNS